MEFSWTTEQDSLYSRILEFARSELDARHSDEAKRAFDRVQWRRAATVGLQGLAVSTRFGGRGHDCLTTALGLEALGRGCADAGFAFAVAAHLLACALPIDQFGTDAQKCQFLPNLCSGEWIGAHALTEAEAGSDVLAMRTNAVWRDGSYTLTGEKLFVTNAPVADVLLVYATTNPGRGMFSISAFLVPRETPGLVVGPTIEKLGLNGAPMGAVRFDGCILPATARLGAAHGGAAIFEHAIRWERSCLFALWIGAMDRQLREVIARANDREQFGRPIARNQAISHRVAEMALRLESARLLLYRACWSLARGEGSALPGSLAKLAVSEAFVKSSLDAIQIFGGRGVVSECGVERDLRDAVPGTIYSGTSDIQRDILARELGLRSGGP